MHSSSSECLSVKFSLCLTKHHAMKAYWGSGGIDARVLDLGTRWRWVVSFTTRPLYPQVKSPWYPLGVLRFHIPNWSWLNKQSQTADKGWSSSLRLGQGVKNPLTVKSWHIKKYHIRPRTWITLLTALYSLVDKDELYRYYSLSSSSDHETGPINEAV
jgi:hypothetical protein